MHNPGLMIMAIAYAVDILLGTEPDQIIYDQSKMRQHLISCFENEEIWPFPKYRNDIISSSSISTTSLSSSQNNSSEWILPRRSSRIRNKNSTKSITISPNRFAILSEDKTSLPATENTDTEHYSVRPKNQTFNPKSIIVNIANTTLSDAEKSVLEKGLNFCPATKEFDKETLLDDTYAFIRKMRLKEFLHCSEENKPETEQIEPDQHYDRTYLDVNIKNPSYQPPTDRSRNLELYLQAIKNSIVELCKEPTKHIHNLNVNEINALKSLQSRNDIIIHQADKGGKTVILNRDEYISACQSLLSDKEFYQSIPDDPTNLIASDIKEEVDKLKENQYITAKEHKFLCDNLQKPRTPVGIALKIPHSINRQMIDVTG